MSDIHQHLQGKTDLFTSIVASAGIPAPLPFFFSFLDETGKVVAVIYSVLGVIYMAKKLFWPDSVRGGDE